MDATAGSPDIVDRVRAVLADHGEVLFAYVFGSAVSGSAHPRSDVDVAVHRTPETRESQARESAAVLPLVEET